MKSGIRQGGFSLVELIIVLGVMTTLMGTAFTLINGFQQRYRYEEAYADAQRNARFAITRLGEIIRSAGTNPTGDSTVNRTDFVTLLSPVTTSGSSSSSASLQLKSDLNGDKLNTTTVSADTDVIVTSENVTLRLDQVNRRIMLTDNTPAGSGTVPIADNITSLTFTDPDGSRRAIQVSLDAVPNGVTVGDPRYRLVSYSTTIRLRNR